MPGSVALPGDRGQADAMERALDAARAAAGEVPVGAVVLGPDGAVLAVSGNRVERDRDASAHAELVAMRAAAAALGSPRLVGCTLVVTLEPCPMCAGAIVHFRGGPGGVRGLRPEGGRGGAWAARVRAARLPAPARRDRRGAGAGVRGAAAGFFPRAAVSGAGLPARLAPHVQVSPEGLCSQPSRVQGTRPTVPVMSAVSLSTKIRVLAGKTRPGLTTEMATGARIQPGSWTSR